MGMHKYIKSLSDLEKIFRCPGKFKFEEHSVAEHSFKVTQIAQFLGTVEEQEDNEINWKVLYEKALNHDYSEIFIGDIKTPVKYADSNLRDYLASVEESMTQNFIENEIPERFRGIYTERLKEGKDETLEGQILSVSDKIDLLYESFGELQKGNPEPIFIEMYEEALSTILKFQNLYCVQYFISEVLTDLLKGKFTNQDKLEKVTAKVLAPYDGER